MTVPVITRHAPYKLSMVPLAAPDPNPSLPSEGGRAIYPYTRKYGFGTVPVERELETLILENPRMQLQVIPGLGGRLWQAMNPVTGDPMFETPKRVGLINFGLRGAWHTGGVEFNFPRGHTVNNLETVPALIRRGADGSASVMVGSMDWMKRVGWSVGIRLQPDCSSVYFDVLLYNRTALPISYTWWINAAVPTHPSLEYVNGQTEVRSHFLGRREHLGEPFSWPVQEGHDLREYIQCVEPTSLFQLAGDSRWFGFYNHQADQGVVRIGSSTDAPGLKFWNSGQAEEGYLWGKYLTCGDRYTNTELQSGRPETQMDYGVLPAHHTLRWTEIWRPIWGLGGLTCASEAVAVHLVADGDGSRLGLLADRPYPACTIKVTGTSQQVFSCDLSAEKPTWIALPFSAALQPLCIEIHASDGRSLFSYQRPEDSSQRSVLADVLQLRTGPEKLPAALSAEELALEAERMERLNFPGPARSLAEKALALDAGLITARVLLARFELKKGNYALAREHLFAALWRNPDHELAHYLLAVSELWKGDVRQAKIEFERVLGHTYTVTSAAWFQLAEIWIAKRDWEQALHALDSCLIHEANHVKALALRVTVLRHQQNRTAAQSALEAAVVLAPLDPLVRAEGWQVAPQPDAGSPWNWRSTAGNQDQYFDLRPAGDQIQDAIEVACDYLACGLLEDADRVLASSLAAGAAPNPLALYWAGYLKTLIGDEPAAARHWSQARQHSGQYAYSFRREDEQALKAALAVKPDDGLALTLLGMLEASRENYELAVPYLEQAALLRPAWDQPYNLLALCFRMLGNPAKAVDCLWKAVETNPENPQVYVELDKLLASTREGSTQRQRLWEKAPHSVLAHDQALGRCADSLLDRGALAQALQALGSHTFFPEEGSSEYRDLLFETHLILGAEKLAEGLLEEALASARQASSYPENLGLTTPFMCYDAPAYVLEAAIQQQRGDTQAAGALLQRAAEERHRETNEAEFFSAIALNRLGRGEEACKKFQGLINKAESDLAWPGRDQEYARFLLALGKAGLSDPKKIAIHPEDFSYGYERKMAVCVRIANLVKPAVSRKD